MSDFVWPSSPAVDDTVAGPYGEVYTWDGTAWTITPAIAGTGGSGPPVEVADTPPAAPLTGALWWNLENAKLYCWDGAEWVVAINTPPASGGGGSSGPPMGVTDGSEAAPGEIGEVLYSNQYVPDLNTNGPYAPLTLTPGDWDVQGAVFIQGTSTPGPAFVTCSLNYAYPGESPNMSGLGGFRFDFNQWDVFSVTGTSLVDGSPLTAQVNARLGSTTCIVMIPTRVNSATPTSLAMFVNVQQAIATDPGPISIAAGIMMRARRMR